MSRPSTTPATTSSHCPATAHPSIRIEVKARIEGAEDFYVTHNEVVTGKNAAPHYRLALVTVSTRGPEHDQVRYVADPFDQVRLRRPGRHRHPRQLAQDLEHRNRALLTRRD